MNLFVACDLNNGIGYKNQLLYRSSVDLKRFAEKTKNSTIVMGYNTFCSLPHVLPNRRHIVFTKKLIVPELELKVNHTIAKFGVCPEVHIVNSLESFFKLISDLNISSNEINVIGGEQIYNLLFDYISVFYITVFNKSFENVDAFFDKARLSNDIFDSRNSIHLHPFGEELELSFITCVRK